MLAHTQTHSINQPINHLMINPRSHKCNNMRKHKICIHVHVVEIYYCTVIAIFEILWKGNGVSPDKTARSLLSCPGSHQNKMMSSKQYGP